MTIRRPTSRRTDELFPKLVAPEEVDCEHSSALAPVFSLGLFAVSVAATILVFLLALNVFSRVVGLVLGTLTIMPLITAELMLTVRVPLIVLLLSLITLLIVNYKATAVLKQNGIRVGFMGADPSEI